MKQIALYFFLIFTTTDGFSQVKVKTDLKTGYERMLKDASKEVAGFIANWKDQTSIPTVAFVRIDTLNKKEILRSDPVTLAGSQVSNAWETKNRPNPENLDILFTTAFLNGNSLEIMLGQIGPVSFTHAVSAGKVISGYSEFHKRDTILRKSLPEKLSDELHLGFKTSKFFLSEDDFRIGDTLYGFAVCSTPVFYRQDPSFSKGYIRTRTNYTYYFKAVIQKPLSVVKN